MVYLVYAGFAKRSDRRAALAAAVVGGESVLFAANGFRCPLTDVAESLGADDGSVTDIFLPALVRSQPARHPRAADRPDRVPPRKESPSRLVREGDRGDIHDRSPGWRLG